MRKRSKYRPKGIIRNPIAYVMESMKPVTEHDNYLLDLKIRNSLAMKALLQGQATKADMTILIDMSNIVESLWNLGFGKEYEGIVVAGQTALLNIIHRATTTLRFVPTGEQIRALQDLLELHDAQMDVITIKDMERAVLYATERLRQKRATILPPMPQEMT